MLPKKHIESLRKTKNRGDRYQKTKHVLVFILGILVIGPSVHELGHITILSQIECAFVFNPEISFTGLTAEVQPLCSPGNLKLLVFYSIGYLNTLIAGTVLAMYRPEKVHTQLYNYLGVGMLLSLFFTIMSEGDIESAVNILVLPDFFVLLLKTMVIMIASLIVFKTFSIIWDESER